MFKKNFPMLLQKGIEVSSLLNSNVFCFSFHYDEWPATHQNTEHCIRSYNSSIFDLRFKYKEIFPEEKFTISEHDCSSMKKSLIIYKFNMIPMLGEHQIFEKNGHSHFCKRGLSIIELCIDSD